jgi:hypothetical protein
LVVGSCHDPLLISNKSLEAAANIVENNKLIYYDNEEDGDTVMPSPAESEIDDNDIRDILSNLIDKATDLSPLLCKSLLLSFKDVFVEEESLLLYDVTNLSKRSLTAVSYTRVPTPALSLLLSTLEQVQRIDKGLLTIIEQSVRADAKEQDPFVKE